MSRLACLSAVVLGLAGGAAWAQEGSSLSSVLQSNHIHGLAFDPQDDNRVLLATHHGLFALDLGTREVVPVGESRQDFMGFSVGGQDSYFASGHPETGGNSGVLHSTDGGVTWTTLSEGVDGPVDFHQMTTSVADPARLYGAYAGGLQRSRDTGATWEVIGPAPDGLIDLAGSALDPDTLYAATEAGLLKSQDAGQTWTPAHPSPLPISFVETGPESTLYAFIVGPGARASGRSEAGLDARLGACGRRIHPPLRHERDASRCSHWIRNASCLGHGRGELAHSGRLE